MMYQLILIQLEALEDSDNDVVHNLVNKSLEKLSFKKCLKLYHIWASN